MKRKKATRIRPSLAAAIFVDLAPAQGRDRVLVGRHEFVQAFAGLVEAVQPKHAQGVADSQDSSIGSPCQRFDRLLALRLAVEEALANPDFLPAPSVQMHFTHGGANCDQIHLRRPLHEVDLQIADVLLLRAGKVEQTHVAI